MRDLYQIDTLEVKIDHASRVMFGVDARKRGVTPEFLISELLKIIATDNLFAAILER